MCGSVSSTAATAGHETVGLAALAGSASVHHRPSSCLHYQDHHMHSPYPRSSETAVASTSSGVSIPRLTPACSAGPSPEPARSPGPTATRVHTRFLGLDRLVHGSHARAAPVGSADPAPRDSSPYQARCAHTSAYTSLHDPGTGPFSWPGPAGVRPQVTPPGRLTRQTFGRPLTLPKGLSCREKVSGKPDQQKDPSPLFPTVCGLAPHQHLFRFMTWTSCLLYRHSPRQLPHSTCPLPPAPA